MVRSTFRSIGFCLVILFSGIGQSLLMAPNLTYADQLTARSLRIESAVVGVVTTHDFTFSYGNTVTAVGSVVFEYCMSPLDQVACVAPQGMDASNATLALQAGETGYTIVEQQTNKLVLSRLTPSAPINNPSRYVFETVANPGGAPDHFFVRISTYASSDGSGPRSDYGAVANTTTKGIFINSEVPPFLKFCVGLVLGNDCTTADENVINLGDMSASRASSGSSQMIAATNAEFGLAIAVYGTTMTSGNNVIPALAVPTVSAPGNSQFGLNLKDNSNPDVGQEPSGGGIINPAAAYGTPNRYQFIDGSTVATSPAATDIRKLTASYIVNITPSQPPGVYTATLTYICAATF